MTRPKKYRHITFNPRVTYYKPRGVPLRTLDEVTISSDELETIRLKYYEDLNQNDGAKKMKISQSTFQRILLLANKKIAQAIITGKAIKIENK